VKANIAERFKSVQEVKPRVKKWTPEDDALLFELKAANTPLKLIAQQLGRSKAAVDGRVRLIDNLRPTRLRGRPWTSSEDNHLRVMLNAGTKASDMAAPLGRTTAAVRDRINYLMNNQAWRRGLIAKK
jgi:hypothetical protein